MMTCAKEEGGGGGLKCDYTVRLIRPQLALCQSKSFQSAVTAGEKRTTVFHRMLQYTTDLQTPTIINTLTVHSGPLIPIIARSIKDSQTCFCRFNEHSPVLRQCVCCAWCRELLPVAERAPEQLQIRWTGGGCSEKCCGVVGRSRHQAVYN